MPDDDSLPGRVRRYARVSTAMGGLAARLAGERYLGIEIDRPRHAAELTRALGGIKGPLMKVAQLLATIPNDGTALACKLQYPDMGSAVEADLSQLKFFLSLYERYDRAVTTDEIHAEIGERLREELDYEREAAHMQLYRLMLADEKGVTIPEPVPALSTARLLTMTWIEGTPMLEAAKRPTAERNEIA